MAKKQHTYARAKRKRKAQRARKAAAARTIQQTALDATPDSEPSRPVKTPKE